MGLNDQDGHRFLTEECGLPDYHALDVPRALATLGLVTQQNGRWWLLDAGRQHVTRIRAERENQRGKDPAQRAVAARTGLLRWFYRQHLAKVHMSRTGQFAESTDAQFEGTPFTEGAHGEIDYAAKDLADKQLIEGFFVAEYKGPVEAEITSAGIECVVDYGGKVSDYLRDQRSQGLSMNVNGPVVYGNIHGAVVSWGNHQAVNRNEQTQQIAPGFEVIAQAVADMLRHLPAFGLAEEDQQDAEAVANEVLVEVTRSQPDRGKVRRALAALRGFLMPVAAGAAAGAGEGAQELAKKAIEQIGASF